MADRLEQGRNGKRKPHQHKRPHVEDYYYYSSEQENLKEANEPILAGRSDLNAKERATLDVDVSCSLNSRNPLSRRPQSGSKV